MKEKEIAKLNRLYKKYQTALYVHSTTLGVLMNELQKVVGKEMQCNEFPGDGLGVAVGDSSIHNYMGFHDAIRLIKEKGTVDSGDFTYM